MCLPLYHLPEHCPPLLRLDQCQWHTSCPRLTEDPGPLSPGCGTLSKFLLHLGVSRVWWPSALALVDTDGTCAAEWQTVQLMLPTSMDCFVLGSWKVKGKWTKKNFL